MIVCYDVYRKEGGGDEDDGVCTFAFDAWDVMWEFVLCF